MSYFLFRFSTWAGFQSWDFLWEFPGVVQNSFTSWIRCNETGIAFLCWNAAFLFSKQNISRLNQNNRFCSHLASNYFPSMLFMSPPTLAVVVRCSPDDGLVNIKQGERGLPDSISQPGFLYDPTIDHSLSNRSDFCRSATHWEHNNDFISWGLVKPKLLRCFYIDLWTFPAW